MGFKKAAQFKNTEALAEYQSELLEYREACSKYTKIRLLADHPRATDAEIIRHARAKREFKEACRKFSNARTKFLVSVREMSQKSVAMSDDEYITQYEGYSLEDTIRQRKVQATLQEIGSEKLDKLSEDMRIFMSLPEDRKDEAIKKLEKGESLRDSFMNSKTDKDDPTLGDFDPI